MVENSNIGFDGYVSNLNATNPKPRNLKGFTIANLNITSLIKKHRSISTVSRETKVRCNLY